MTETFLFLFGNTPSLSLIELEAILPGVPVQSISEDLVSITQPEKTIDAQKLIDTLGGTKKILKLIETLPAGTSDQELEEKLFDTLSFADNKITFGLAELGRDHREPLEAALIKQKLVKAGYKVRYLDGSRHGLSSAVLSHHKVREITVLQTADAILLTETVAVQDIDNWSLRDYGKPYADRKKGLLPPKVARMMVNLAVGAHPSETSTLLDPFCGSGTVLMEALERDVNVVGSDLDQDAVAGTRQNIDWYSNIIQTTNTINLYQQDATRIELPNNQKVEYLVTEPFLGKPKPQPTQLPNIFKGLEKMYLGAFKQWRRVLKPGAKVVIIFPAVLASHTTGYPEHTLKTLIDKLAEFGYTTSSEPVVYHRPQAIISRQIYQFTYQE